jgi:adenylyltransferase/sulfurtransferase
VLGSLQALEALKLLLALPGIKPDEMLIFDLITLNTQRLRARRMADCDAHRRAASPAPAATPEELDVRFGSLAEAGVLGPVPGVFGSLQALEALKLLLGLPGLKADEMLIFDLITLNTQRLRARRMPDCEAHRRATSSDPVAAPEELDVRFGSLADASRAGFVFVDVRDSRERETEPLPAGSLHLPMSKLLTSAATLDLAGRYLLICATGKRSTAAAGLLRSQGFADCRSLRGGLKSLKASA